MRPRSTCSAPSTLNLVLRLAADKFVNYGDDEVEDEAEEKKKEHGDMKEDDDEQDEDEEAKSNNNESWYYLQGADVWRPFEAFISLILCCRYNQGIRGKFALFSRDPFSRNGGEGAHDGVDVRFLLRFGDKNGGQIYHEMYEPKDCLIEYGYLDKESRHMVRCQVPDEETVNAEIELLYLLSTNNKNKDMDLRTKQHLSLLPHPSNAYLLATWLGELLFTLKWMKSEEVKLKHLVMRDGINSDQFKHRFLRNKKRFKQILRNECGVPLGIGHLLYNKLDEELSEDVMLRSSNDIYQSMLDFLGKLRHKKVMEIQVLFMQKKVSSTSFFNDFLKCSNFESDTKLGSFLKNELSLKLEQIQAVIPSIKSAFQINTSSHSQPQPQYKYNINTDRTATVLERQKKGKSNKPIASYHVWLGRNVLYSKQRLIKQQNDVKHYIEGHDLGSTALRKLGKKRFVRDLHSRCRVACGPLNQLYDDLPIDYTEDYRANEVVEFISNYLYQLRSNNMSRARDRCNASALSDEHFATKVVPNVDGQLFVFLKDVIKIRNHGVIERLIPEIQRYAQNLYGDVYGDVQYVQNERDDDKQNDDKHDVVATYGTWLSELCFERTLLTKQQKLMSSYFEEQDINDMNQMEEWSFRHLLMQKDMERGFGMSSIETTKVLEQLYIEDKVERLDSKQKLIEIVVNVVGLYGDLFWMRMEYGAPISGLATKSGFFTVFSAELMLTLLLHRQLVISRISLKVVVEQVILSQITVCGVPICSE